MKLMWNIYNILRIPISFDQGTEFIIVGVDPVTLPLIVIRKSEVFDISNVSDRVATFRSSCP